jgi:hypothetical protein
LFSIEASQYNNLLKLLHQLYSDYPDHQHITIEDFNLYYLLWAGIHTPAAYTAADRLIKVIIKKSTA